MANAEAAAKALQDFRAIGVRIALDDFGTGYSSLGYIQRLPLDKIKIDRSFVAALDEPGGERIARAVITFCHTIGLSCVAEGVETPSQQRQLQEAGCGHAQGYLFSRPMTLDALLAQSEPGMPAFAPQGLRA
jgi:EAL domain-containing protein (putative c-di-GMP-specific phosphodiesterase class I)